ncbi:hypothetical protein AT15_08465 [Kosmotoga arenicorallina S304]|uniref:SCP2 domain-containing protein n=1 Tax=Kosmotoga arenicorallina S304 TaxID=1453497 RepID=A0A176K1X3_9BACT|nr:SCP2 sterol-binding domain-containing protein [Kosmotoga arenicorallina]OAA30999.1 hypothetical protein AT15_08465 [Kosmotoga arenicorallina S304]
MALEEIIRSMEERLEGNSFGDFNGKFLIAVNTADSPVYLSVEVSNGKLKLSREKLRDADCKIETDESTLTALLEGTRSPITAFMTGKLKVSGNLDLALKFSKMLESV